MARLRAPDGCPWDREQSFDSIRANTVEETYEVLEAIANRDWNGLREELGDLLLQVIFYAEMAAEEHRFTIADVLDELADKLVRRHPHVFGEEKAASAEAALARWNAAKTAEGKRADRSLMAGIPRSLPALAEAAKQGQRAARAGFDWDDAAGVWHKLDEEIAELRRAQRGGRAGAAGVSDAVRRLRPGKRQAGRAAQPRGVPRPSMTEPDRARQEEELGDLLFTAANLARHLGLDPEAALKHANQKFARRFRRLEAMGGPGAHHSAAEWEELWNQVKREETQSPKS